MILGKGQEFTLAFNGWKFSEILASRKLLFGGIGFFASRTIRLPYKGAPASSLYERLGYASGMEWI